MSHKDITAISEAPCACGCGETVRVRTSRGHLILYRPGHHRVVGGLIRRTWRTFTCLRCSKQFESRFENAKYCSQSCCWNKVMPPRKSGPAKTDRSIFKVSRSQRIQRLYMLGQTSVCARCGWGRYKEVLELHHKNEDPSDGRRENLEMLCPTCHEVHHFESKTGRWDNTRYAKAKALREKLGLPSLPVRSTKNALQRLLDNGTITVNTTVQ